MERLVQEAILGGCSAETDQVPAMHRLTN